MEDVQMPHTAQGEPRSTGCGKPATIGYGKGSLDDKVPLYVLSCQVSPSRRGM